MPLQVRRASRPAKERPLFSLSFVGEMISTLVERAIPREPDGIVRRPQLSLKALQQIYQKDSLPGQRPHSPDGRILRPGPPAYKTAGGNIGTKGEES